MGVAGSLCRRRATDVPASGCKFAPLSSSSSAHVKAAARGRMELESRGTAQLSARPNAPGYSDTPLLTVGKEVRIVKDGNYRLAMIECVNEADHTVEICYLDGDEEEAEVPSTSVRPLEGYENTITNVAVGAGNTPIASVVSIGDNRSAERASAEDMRQRGVRPNAPSYFETPCISVGKTVRVRLTDRCRRAHILCVDDADGTVEVEYVHGAQADTAENSGADEETVASSTISPLEEFEVAGAGFWEKAFADDIYGATASLKDGANSLFKLQDFDAAAEYYGFAIDQLRHRTATGVLLNQSGSLVFGRVLAAESDVDRVDVTVSDAQVAGNSRVIRGVPRRTLIAVHANQLTLQGSLYMNRARCLSQVGKQQEAAQDLSVVIGLWGSPTALTLPDRKEQLTKAHYLRAKTRLFRMKFEPARVDLKSAWALQPADATAKLLRLTKSGNQPKSKYQMRQGVLQVHRSHQICFTVSRQVEREIEIAQKEQQRSNKRIAKEIAKLADDAMSKLSGAQLAAFAQAQ